MSLTKIQLIKCSLVLLLLSISLQAVIAQKGTHVTRRVNFQPGSNSIVVKGRARWGTSYVYLLRARAGQTLTVHLEGVPVVRIIAPGAKDYQALPGGDIVKDWSGKLPETGDYRIDVGHTNDEYATAPYKLEIRVE